MLDKMEHFRVLIVDDSLVIRGLLSKILASDKQIEVVDAVCSAEEASLFLEKQQVDVVTLDVEMPGTNGLQYLPTLCRLNLPVILLSGHAAEGADMRGTALMLGATACFNKANAVRDADKLIALVKAACRHRVKIDSLDANCLAHAKEEAARAANELGVRPEWKALH